MRIKLILVNLVLILITVLPTIGFGDPIPNVNPAPNLAPNINRNPNPIPNQAQNPNPNPTSNQAQNLNPTPTLLQNPNPTSTPAPLLNSPQFTFINNSSNPNFSVMGLIDSNSTWYSFNKIASNLPAPVPGQAVQAQNTETLNCGNYYAGKPVVIFPKIRMPGGEMITCGYEMCNKGRIWQIVISNDGNGGYQFNAMINGNSYNCNSL